MAHKTTKNLKQKHASKIQGSPNHSNFDSSNFKTDFQRQAVKSTNNYFKADHSNTKCFHCGEFGHVQSKCPLLKPPPHNLHN